MDDVLWVKKSDNDMLHPGASETTAKGAELRVKCKGLVFCQL